MKQKITWMTLECVGYLVIPFFLGNSCNSNRCEIRSRPRREYRPTAQQFLLAHLSWSPREWQILRWNPALRETVGNESLDQTRMVRRCPAMSGSFMIIQVKSPHDIYTGCSDHSSLLLPRLALAFPVTCAVRCRQVVGTSWGDCQLRKP